MLMVDAPATRVAFDERVVGLPENVRSSSSARALPGCRSLVVGRAEAFGPSGERQPNNRLPFRALGDGTYRGSARLASGRHSDTRTMAPPWVN